ncbi:heme-binding protein [Palleronia sp.]|uniref:GlcG/HbpS family heme-binding protein n=1 Tax=Palleronia sp. TaxID=1940284 RepID=UPI0035C836DE
MTRSTHQPIVRMLVLGLAVTVATPVAAQEAAAVTDPECPVTHQDLTEALRQSAAPAAGPSNGGLGNNEWAAVVDRTGTVCAITYSGETVRDQWLGSRAIAVEKAFTANAFSLPNFALSTANLYAGAQPGGYLYGIITTNPVREELLYLGDVETWGTPSDPLVGEIAGGTVVFAGGLPLYDGGELVGGLGASGDTSCADHNIAWRVRNMLDLGDVPAGVSPSGADQIIYDIGPSGSSASGYGHPMCGRNAPDVAEEIGAGFVPEWNETD